MSVISYTDVRFIHVAAEVVGFFLNPRCSAQQEEDEVGAVARSVICTRCRNGRVYTGGRCVGLRLQERRGD